MLQARRDNDAGLPQTELFVRTQGSEDRTMADELSDSTSRRMRVAVSGLMIRQRTDYVFLLKFKQTDMDKSLKKINVFRKKHNVTHCSHENSKICPMLNEGMETPTDFPRTPSALRHKTPGENLIPQIPTIIIFYR